MIEMNIKLTKAQAEIAEWAVDAAPEETTDPVEEPLYIVGEHPTMMFYTSGQLHGRGISFIE